MPSPKVCPHSSSHLYKKITPTLMESKPKPDLKLNARSSLRCKSSQASPLASPLSSPVARSTSAEINVDSLVAHEVEANSGPEDPSRKKKVKANCPCLSISQGQAWLLVCTDCKQSWHNTCANLKGTITKPVEQW